ncbi:MAG: 2-phosphosulfolactate phosphatase [Desulfovibrio sp.]
MRLNIAETLAAAPSGAEFVVVVDVFRVWASVFAVLDQGADVLLARDAQQALALRSEHPDWILAGEQLGVLPEGFDYPNSPSRLQSANLAGRTVVLATDAGTPAAFAVGDAGRVLLASFINASATAECLTESKASAGWLLAPGERGEIRSLEDTMCAMFLKNAVEGYPNSYEVLRKHLRGLPSAAMFFDSARDDAPELDFELCMDLDRYDHVLEAVPDGQGLYRVRRHGGATHTSQGGAV